MRKVLSDELEPYERCCADANLQRDPDEYFLVCHSCGHVEYGSNVNYRVESLAPEEFWGSHVHRTPTLYDPFKYSVRRLDLVCGQVDVHIEEADIQSCKAWYARTKKQVSLQNTRQYLRSAPHLKQYATNASKFHNMVTGENCGIVSLPSDVRSLILNAMKVFNYENLYEKWTKKAINVDFLARKIIELYHQKYPDRNLSRQLSLFKSGVGKKASVRNEELWNKCKDIIKEKLNL